MAIKRCTLADLEELGEISVSTYYDTFAPFNTEENTRIYLEEAYNLPKLTRELENPQSAFYFLQENDQTVGYIKLNWGEAQTEAIAPEGLEIERIYIKKEHKRRGYGKTLLLFAQETAKELQKKSIWLGVWEFNDNALAFYQRWALKELAVIPFLWGMMSRRIS